LVGPADSKKREVEIPLDGLSQGMERIFSAIINDLDLARAGVPFNPLPPLPFAAFHAYGQALEILRGQSLDPRARIVLGENELRQAHMLLAAVTEEAPEFQRAWAARAMVSAMLKDSARASEELEEAKVAGSRDAPAVALAAFYMACRAGEIDRGIVLLGKALNTHLGFLQGLGYLGQAYLQAQRFEEAVKLFTLYGSRAPENPWVGVMRAEALAQVGRNEVGLAELQTLAARFPDSLVVLGGLAARQLDAWRYDEARQTLERGLRLARLATVEIDQGKLERGLSLAAQAARGVDESRGEPLAGYPQAVLGRVLALVGRDADAFDAFRTAARLGVSSYELRTLWTDQRLTGFVRDPRFALTAPR